MTELIHFILITAGLTYGLTRSKLFEVQRDRIEELYEEYKGSTFWWAAYHITACPLCMGFWASIPSYLLVYKKIDVSLVDFITQGVGFMFIGSITSFIIYLIIQKLKIKH